MFIYMGILMFLIYCDSIRSTFITYLTKTCGGGVKVYILKDLETINPTRAVRHVYISCFF